MTLQCVLVRGLRKGCLTIQIQIGIIDSTVIMEFAA